LVCGSSKFGAPLYDAAGIDAAGKLATAIEAGTVDINDTTTGLTPLGWASFGDNVLAAELLCGAGAKLTPDCLHNAASCGHANIIRYLVDKHGADPNGRERPDGPTPLHQAALQRFTEDASLAVQVLLEAGANPLALDDKGRTPRQVALDTRPPDTDEDQSERATIAELSSQGDECPKADPQAVARVLSTWAPSAAASSM
jgi:ankyrin repeat protein